MLAQRHQELSGTQVNWLGTYQHAVQVWIKGWNYTRHNRGQHKNPIHKIGGRF